MHPQTLSLAGSDHCATEVLLDTDHWPAAKARIRHEELPVLVVTLDGGATHLVAPDGTGYAVNAGA
jgi:hypothetical protein